MSRLTKSQETYLKTIFALSGEGVRLTDVAARLGISKASACVAVTKLEQEGLVTRDDDRLIVLTPDGDREARRILDNFTVVNLFLMNKLHLAPRVARADADALEHIVSDETVNALRAALGQANGLEK